MSSERSGGERTHTFAFANLRNSAPICAMQKLLGHTTLDVTLRYAATATDDLGQEHRVHSPVAHIAGSAWRRHG